MDLHLAEFQARSDKERARHLEDIAEEDKTKMSKKVTTLYYKGLQRSPDHLCQCIYNINVMGQFITEDFSRSALWSSLRSYL